MKKEEGSFWPRWRHRWTYLASLYNQKKDNNQFKNKKQPELPENHTVWKSDKQRVKETFIQAGRRDEMGSRGAENTRQGTTGGPGYLRADKPGETTVERDRPHNPGFQCGEIKPQNL